MNNTIIGTWKTDPEDIATQAEYGNVTIRFQENGQLIYTIFSEGKEQKILLTYEISGNLLITDQPSKPGKEVTKFHINENKLELDFAGTKCKYIRVSEMRDSAWATFFRLFRRVNRKHR